MHQFDDDVLECFLDNQLQLFPEKVAETLEEAENFLEESMAVVVDSVEEVIEYFEEEGIDTEGAMDGEPWMRRFWTRMKYLTSATADI